MAGQIEAKQVVVFKDLGLTGYQEAWDLQTDLNQELVRWKRSDQRNGLHKHYLVFCEHKPVYTLGKSGSEEHLRIEDAELASRGIQFYRINRGGDITFHGPGQLVIYPIFDLDRFFTDVHRYVRSLEEVVIRLLDHFGVRGERLNEYTGVWIRKSDGNWRKICAIGVHLSRWVTMHGLALNVNTRLDYFEHIVPCGIDGDDKGITSLALETGREIAMDEVKLIAQDLFAEVFGFEYETEN